MSLKRKALSGVKWSAISTIILAIIAILKISILTRFLEKFDFGLMAVVMLVLGFMNIFLDLGLTTAILHVQKITKKQYSSLYWTNFGFSIVLYILVFLLTPFIADFYKETELLKLIPLMGSCLLLTAFGKQFKTILQKELKFKTISLIDICVGFCSLILAIYLAFENFGVYALVYSVLFQYAISNIVFFMIGINSYGLRIHFRYSDTKPFLKIGLFSVGSDVVNYFNRDIDTILVGKIFGMEILGGYNLARQLVRRPLQIIDPIITKVSMSVFPKVQDDDKKLSLYIVKVIRKLCTLNAFVYGIIVLFAAELINILYGKNYKDIIDLVRLFAVISYLRSAGGQITPLIVAKGRTDLGFYWNLFSFIFIPLSLYFSSQYGIVWVVIGLIIIQFIFIIPSWFVFYYKLLKMSILKYVKLILIPLFVSFFVIMTFFILSTENLLNQTIFAVILGICLTMYLYYVDDDMRKLKSQLMSKLKI